MKATEEEMNQFLDDTIKYYSENVKRRCKSEKGCFYDAATIGKDKVSAGCAIGRWMTDAQKKKADKGGQCPVDELPSDLVPKSLRKYHMEFLVSVQLLHDNDNNWHMSGLSDEGHSNVGTIRDNIARGHYD